MATPKRKGPGVDGAEAERNVDDATHTNPNPPPSQALGGREDAARFLACLDPTTDVFTFQTFDDNQKRKDRTLVKVLHGTLDQHWDTLQRLNDAGAGIFVTPNETDGKGRKAENITRIRAVFGDLDGAPLEPVLAQSLKPHMVIESSPGRWHPYWRVTGLPLDQFRAVQKEIIRRFGGDKTVHDLSRVMRLPGFLHRKGEPFMPRIISISDAPPYTADDISQHFANRSFDDGPRKTRAKAKPAAAWHTANDNKVPAWLVAELEANPHSIGAGLSADPADVLQPPTVEKIKAALAVIPADDYPLWMEIGSALNTELGAEGEPLFHEWSKTSTKYNADVCTAKYADFAMVTKFGAGTIFHHANQSEPDWRHEFQAEEPPPKEPPPGAQSGAATSGLHWLDEPWSPLDETWLVYGLMPDKGKGLLSAQYGTGKSFIALDLAFCVMTGQPFAGHKIKRKGGVLFLAAEGSGGLKKRLAGLVEHKYKCGNALPFLWYKDYVPLLAGKGRGEAALIKIAQQAAKEMEDRFGVPLVLIIVDTLTAASGVKDDDKVAEGTDTMNVLEKVSDATSTFALGISHMGKQVERGTRGTSAKEDAADTIFYVMGGREGDDTVKGTRLIVHKVRDGRRGFEVPFTLKEVLLGTDREGEPVTTTVVEWGKPGQARPKVKSKTPSVRLLEQAMQKALEKGPAETVKHGTDRIRVVSRENLQAMFRAVHRGNDHAANLAFRRALQDAGASIVIVPVNGDDFIGHAPEPM